MWRPSSWEDCIVMVLVREGPCSIRRVSELLGDKYADDWAFAWRTFDSPASCSYQPVYQRLNELEGVRVLKDGTFGDEEHPAEEEGSRRGSGRWRALSKTEAHAMRLAERESLDPDPALVITTEKAAAAVGCTVEFQVQEIRPRRWEQYLVLKHSRGEAEIRLGTNHYRTQDRLTWEDAVEEAGLV